MLPSTYDGGVPEWPLLADIARRATSVVTEQALAVVEHELETAEPRKKAGLTKRALDLRRHVTVLGMQIAEQERVELEIWASLWVQPQAAAWAELGWTRDVAQYVRHKSLGEMGSLDDAKEARQWSDRLGLNPAAMMRNRWRVATTTPVEDESPTSGSSRDRLRVVPNAAGA